MTWEGFWSLLEQVFGGDKYAPVAPYTPPTTPTPPKPTNPPPPLHTPLINAFCAEIQNMEGWTPGSMSFKRNNPGNLRCPPLHSLAVRCDNGFCVFKDEATGMKALTTNITLCAQGKSTVYNQQAQQRFGLPDSSFLNLNQFFLIRDPASDGNDPAALAVRFGKMLGVNPAQFTLKQLL